MRGLRKGRDGLFPKIKYWDYMLITLGEVSDSAGAYSGQNTELLRKLGRSSQTQPCQHLWTFWRSCARSLGWTLSESFCIALSAGWGPVLVSVKRP